MASGSIYMKCEEPDTVEFKDNTFDQTSRKPGGFPLQHCRCFSEGTSISILYIANAVLFLLWLITTVVLTAKYSKMATQLEQLQGNQSLLIAFDSKIEKQLDILHSSQSTYASQMNSSLKRLEVGQTKINETLLNLWNENQKTWDEMFKVEGVLNGMNASACKMCPAGWLLDRGKCYNFHEQAMHWSSARDFCQLQGGNLVVINDYSEQQFLQSNTKRSISYWIGLHDMKSESTFSWVDNSPLNYMRWSRGEPNDYGTGEDCVTMQENGFWNDYGCGNDVPGTICEKTWNCQ